MRLLAASLVLLAFCLSSFAALQGNIVPSSVVIDGVETWGHFNPLSQPELNSLIALKNKGFSFSKTDKLVYYGTIFANEKAYKRFTGESMQSFLARHFKALSQILFEGLEYCDECAKQFKLVMGKPAWRAFPKNFPRVVLRRLVVIGDGVVPPYSESPDYLDYRFEDSDGGWHFEGDYSPPSKKTYYAPGEVPPTDSSYYNPFEKLDYGLLHEFGHSILHLIDYYFLDYRFPYEKKDGKIIARTPADFREPEAVADLPNPWNGGLNWREYRTVNRPGIVSFAELMSNSFGSSPRAGLFTELLLAWRASRKKTHDFSEAFRDLNGFQPSEMPKFVTLELKNQDGASLKGGKLEIYRVFQKEGSSFYSDGKIFEKQFEGSIDDKGRARLGRTIKTHGGIRVFMGNPFSGPPQRSGDEFKDVLHPLESTLLLKVKDDDGKTEHFRWMDARDFAIPYFLGFRDYARFTLKLVSESDPAYPTAFDWKITYSYSLPD
jgi:hypothetical protein